MAPLGSQSVLGCEKICATFCPKDPKAYCNSEGCGTTGASCNTGEACVMYPYEFAATLECGPREEEPGEVDPY